VQSHHKGIHGVQAKLQVVNEEEARTTKQNIFALLLMFDFK